MIECLKITLVNKGSLLGFCDLSIPQMGMDIFNIAIFQKGSHKWISFPSKEYESETGEKKYLPYIRFKRKESMDNFTRQALVAIEPEIQKALAQQPR